MSWLFSLNFKTNTSTSTTNNSTSTSTSTANNSYTKTNCGNDYSTKYIGNFGNSINLQGNFNNNTINIIQQNASFNHQLFYLSKKFNEGYQRAKYINSSVHKSDRLESIKNR